jgi:hypothetical protein
MMVVAMTGKWSEPGVPHRGWNCIDIHDVGEPSHLCEMCESQMVRYIHTSLAFLHGHRVRQVTRLIPHVPNLHSVNRPHLQYLIGAWREQRLEFVGGGVIAEPGASTIRREDDGHPIV